MKQAAFVVATFAIAAVGWFVLKPPSQQQQVQATPGPVASIDTSVGEHDLFAEAYAAKMANDAWVRMKMRSGHPYQDFPEERQIKEARAAIARTMKTPAGVKPVRIPRVSSAPSIDGMVNPNEWSNAARIPIGVNGNDTTMFAMCDGGKLYLAVDAPGDTTATGYDQFRFYFHLDITPQLVNERVHLGKRGGKLGGIRQTTVRWPGEEGSSKSERWKKFPISDWTIFQNAVGATTADSYRMYEMALDINECGLPLGTPFPVRAEIEADPRKDANGKFKGRTYVGRLGAQTAPVWFVIE